METGRRPGRAEHAGTGTGGRIGRCTSLNFLRLPTRNVWSVVVYSYSDAIIVRIKTGSGGPKVFNTGCSFGLYHYFSFAECSSSLELGD